ncbi:hypothetical protein Ctha_0965 [Chloroherpeton thalassium ATCC 35110]|uniref:Uncharacterized protein n=1 Tax=Chloroherpeton thalassium (strain ATCC 35110 / GB-78) TaxID=517418 RepID=B3QXF6_CHLT3|nr:hypothetical protein [Chloroherpeton thalassium]ACF13430.1 hypothetical protein Ctha_0965 [Chloroherpeton thalassium ATCC 35110]
MPELATALSEIYSERIPETEQLIAIWINAFIPAQTTNARVVPAGAYKGQVSILGPFPWSGCFLSDNRDFSSDLDASVRMQSLVLVDFQHNPPAWKEFHRTGITVELLCYEGQVTCLRRAPNTQMQFAEIKAEKNFLSLRLRATAKNPCVEGAPDIAYYSQPSHPFV